MAIEEEGDDDGGPTLSYQACNVSFYKLHSCAVSHNTVCPPRKWSLDRTRACGIVDENHGKEYGDSPCRLLNSVFLEFHLPKLRPPCLLTRDASRERTQILCNNVL